MKKKKIVILFSILIFFICLIFAIPRGRKQNYYYIYGTITCIATDFNQMDGKSYVTIRYGKNNQEEKIFYVEKSDLINEIGKNSLENIIGISVNLKIPEDALKKNNINIDTLTLFDLLDNHNFDTYFVVEDIFWEDEKVSEE